MVRGQSLVLSQERSSLKLTREHYVGLYEVEEGGFVTGFNLDDLINDTICHYSRQQVLYLNRSVLRLWRRRCSPRLRKSSGKILQPFPHLRLFLPNDIWLEKAVDLARE